MSFQGHPGQARQSSLYLKRRRLAWRVYRGSVDMVKAATAAIYWGSGGQYGPFDEQQEGEWAGWPNFGQVLRSFRKKARLTAKAFGVIYGRAVNPDGSAISERQILRMELDNQVPLDMNRRKLIARLLQIPPLLFGLGALEEVLFQPGAQAAGAVRA